MTKQRRKWIVLTGGSCSGKTTTLEELEEEYGERGVFVKEAATLVLPGYPTPGRNIPVTQFQPLFQPVICQLQRGMEQSWDIAAGEQGAKVLIMDRGSLDGAAYTEGGRDDFLKLYGYDLEEEFARYDMVIHLVSTAVCAPHLYGQTGNQYRYETLEEAQALEYRVQAAWEGHPNRHIISGEGGIDQVIAQVTYACASAKTIQAIYYSTYVSLVLSDGRSLTLPHTMSGSGARYAWEKGGTTFVFWNKGNTAFIEENKTVTFSDCNEK